MKHSLLLYLRHHLCPPLHVSLHLLCISLLPCRKKHNSFVVYSSQSGSELGVVSCFLCSPDSADSGPVALFGLRNSCFFFRKLHRVITITIIKILSLCLLQICGRFSALSHQPTAVTCQRTRLWWKQCDAKVTHTHQQEKKLCGDRTDWLTWSMTAAR